MRLELQPVTLREARAFTADHHRHHGAPQGGLFAVAVAAADSIVGVAIVGRPVARHQADGFTAEVTRLCVLPDQRNACSMLYAASWRACRALGYRRLITYTLADEPGTSLRAAGWWEVGKVTGRSWSRPQRARYDKHPLLDKVRWQAGEIAPSGVLDPETAAAQSR